MSGSIKGRSAIGVLNASRCPVLTFSREYERALGTGLSIQAANRGRWSRRVRAPGDARRPGPAGTLSSPRSGQRVPTKCSGLDVVRYDPDTLHDQFGTSFRLLRHLTEIHQTPAGTTQQFTFCYCKTSEAT